MVVNSGYDLVLVNFNYRVGALGFLTSETVRQNGDLNAGLLDQRKALKWVQQYIHLVRYSSLNCGLSELTEFSLEVTRIMW